MEANRTTKNLIDQTSTDENSAALLQVPQFQFGAQRSRSVESGSIDSSVASYLEIPKRFQRRRSSNSKSPVHCVHCMYIEEYERWLESGGGSGSGSTFDKTKDNEDSSDTSISDDDDTDESIHIETTTDENNHLTIPTLIPPHCNIKFSLSHATDAFPLQSAYDDDTTTTTNAASPPPHETQCDIIQPVPAIDIELPAQLQPNRGRRRSISRQEAIFIEPTGSSLENLDSVKSPGSPKKSTNNEKPLNTSCDSNDYVQDYFLAVPETDLRRDRAASVDSSFSKLSSNGKTEELQSKNDGFLTVPTNAVRSRSVDIVLPTNEQARYKALALAGPSMSKRYVNYKCIRTNNLENKFNRFFFVVWLHVYGTRLRENRKLSSFFSFSILFL